MELGQIVQQTIHFAIAGETTYNVLQSLKISDIFEMKCVILKSKVLKLNRWF